MNNYLLKLLAFIAFNAISLSAFSITTSSNDEGGHLFRDGNNCAAYTIIDRHGRKVTKYFYDKEGRRLCIDLAFEKVKSTDSNDAQ